MSFSKAKRFENVPSCTPSPAEYNVAVKHHIAGVTLSKSERFVDSSPAHSDESVVSSGSKITFKTPQVSKRTRKLNKNNNVVAAPKSAELFKNEEEFEALKEKIVECNNKDLYIKDLIDQIEELKSQVAELDEKANFLLEQKHKEKKHREEEADKEIETLRNNLAQMQVELDRMVYNYEEKIEEMERDHEKGLKDLKRFCEEDRKRDRHDFAARIKQMEENHADATLLAEIQMKERFEDQELNWQLKLEQQEKEAHEILKECQAISEYNIIQSELEKNKYKNELIDKTKELEQAQNGKERLLKEQEHLKLQIAHLQAKLSETIIELNNSRQQLGEETQRHQKELQKYIQDKRTYEVTSNKTFTTVEALKRRLLESDADVEQLKSELEASEASKNELQAQYNQLAQELEKAPTLDTFKNEISAVREELSSKVNHLKTQYAQETSILKKQLEMKQRNLEEAKKLLEQQSDKITQAQNLLENAENTNGKLHKENAALKKMLAEQESLIGPFREQLEMYEEENRNLSNEKCDIENENKEIQLKYASMLGHQNMKQKIKYMVNLKKKNIELVQSNKSLEKTVAVQNKKIDKLKRELSKIHSSPNKSRQDKENLNNSIKGESPRLPFRAIL